jgi:hypothetical protein
MPKLTIACGRAVNVSSVMHRGGASVTALSVHPACSQRDCCLSMAIPDGQSKRQTRAPAIG